MSERLVSIVPAPAGWRAILCRVLGRGPRGLVGGATRGVTADDGTPPLVFAFVPAEAFAAVREPSAEALLGDPHGSNVLSRGGLVVVYGNGGAGKTTLGARRRVPSVQRQRVARATGRAVPCRVGRERGAARRVPRQARQEVRAREGPPLEGRLNALEEPWARVNLSNATTAPSSPAGSSNRKSTCWWRGRCSGSGVQGRTPAKSARSSGTSRSSGRSSGGRSRSS